MKRPARKQMDVQITCLLCCAYSNSGHLTIKLLLGLQDILRAHFQDDQIRVINGQNSWALVFVLKSICDKLGMARDN